MGVGAIVMLLCAALWLVHALQLARLPWSHSWPSLSYAALGVSASLCAWWLVPRYAAYIAVGLVMVMLTLPALATRAATRALRWGNVARARGLAAVAHALRPIPAQRKLRRAIDVAWRLARGDDVDIDLAIAELGTGDDVERRAQRVAFLSWTGDYVAMALELESESVRAMAMRTGMASIVTMVVGETGSDRDLFTHYRQLVKAPSLQRREGDGTWALCAMAAYLGAPEIVVEHAQELRSDVPPDRIAFAWATAHQRAGDPKRAASLLDEAMSAPALSPSASQQLRYRGHNVLVAMPASEERSAVLADVAEKLRARRDLGELGLSFRRPSPLTWALALAVSGVYAWQIGRVRSSVFKAWGLLSPFVDAPDPWRLVSYAFLHLDAGHLAVNAIGLLIFGRFVERHYGALRMSAIYLAGAIAGGVAFLAFARGYGVAIGASGAVLALFGATGARVATDRALRKSPQGRRELIFLAVVALVQLAVDAFWAQSSGSAHAGGLGAGIALGWLLRRTSGNARRETPGSPGAPGSP